MAFFFTKETVAPEGSGVNGKITTVRQADGQTPVKTFSNRIESQAGIYISMHFNIPFEGICEDTSCDS